MIGELRSLQERPKNDQVGVSMTAERAWAGLIDFSVKNHSICIILGVEAVGGFHMIFTLTHCGIGWVDKSEIRDL